MDIRPKLSELFSVSQVQFFETQCIIISELHKFMHCTMNAMYRQVTHRPTTMGKSDTSGPRPLCASRDVNTLVISVQICKV